MTRLAALRARAYHARRVPAMRLLLCMLVVFTVGAVLARRFGELEAQVEQLAVAQFADALARAVEMEAIVRSIRGEAEGIERLTGANPVLLLQATPANYLGEGPGLRGPLPGVWWFDSSKRELVYSPRSDRLVTVKNGARCCIRFKVLSGRTDAPKEAHATRRGLPRLVAIDAPAWLEGSSAVASQTRATTEETR